MSKMTTKEDYQSALDEIKDVLIEYDYVDGRKVSANPIMEKEVAKLQELINNLKENKDVGN